MGSKIKFNIISTGKTALAPVYHEMVFVEGGIFQIGGNSGESDEKPIHSVTLSDFNIGKYEVTQVTRGNFDSI